MQSYLSRYISTFVLETTTTPAIVSHDDALTIIESWGKKTYGTMAKVKKDYIPGLFIYETPEDKVEFPIERVREFIKDTAQMPYEGKNLYMLLGIDTASHAAMNALLKVLEDTPAYAIIILVVADREALLDTIHSRTIDLFRQSRRIIDETHRDAIREFFADNKESWIVTLFAMKPTREEAIDILTLALEYAPSEYLESIEQGFIYLYTTNESPRNVLDIVFLR